MPVNGATFFGEPIKVACTTGCFQPTAVELMDPYFGMYSEMYESCALAARQQWGSKGIYIPETVGFSGLPELPEDVAKEMRII